VLYMVFFLWWLQIGLLFVHWQRFFYCFITCVSVEESQRDVFFFELNTKGCLWICFLVTYVDDVPECWAFLVANDQCCFCIIFCLFS
jgi:hypothetical protein